MEIDKVIQASKRRQKKHWYFRDLEHLYHNAVVGFESNYWVQKHNRNISSKQRQKLLAELGKKLNYTFICEENDYKELNESNAFAYGLTADKGFITVPAHSKCISWVAHEMAHCLAHSLIFSQSQFTEFEPYHGPIFQNYLCYCYTLVTKGSFTYYHSVAKAYPNFELLSADHRSQLIRFYTEGHNRRSTKL